MKDTYEGLIIKESLENPDILKDMKILSEETSPNDGWNLYRVEITPEDFAPLSKTIKPKKYYMHFWKGKEAVVIFRDKIFKFNHDDKESWKPIIEYGLTQDIPKEQLDFPID